MSGYAIGTDNSNSSNSVHSVSSSQIEMLKKELARTGVMADEVKARYHIDNLEDMPDDIYKRAMAALSRTESAGVA